MQKLFQALAAFQQEVPNILKDSKGYNYNYASLGHVLNVINPYLKKHNLGFTQLEGLTEDNKTPILITRIFETTSGQYQESVSLMDLNFVWIQTEKVKQRWVNNKKEQYIAIINEIRGFESMNDQQAKGAVLTYTRRYALSAALGLITDQDTDGKGVQPEEPKKETAPPPKEPKKAPQQKEKKSIEDWPAALSFAAQSKENRDRILATKKLTKEQKEALEKMHPQAE